MFIKTHLGVKNLKAILTSSLAFSAVIASSLIGLTPTNLNSPTKQLSINAASVDPTIPTPDYVTYLQKYWDWNEKLKPVDTETTTNWGSVWKANSSFYPADLPFMVSDFGIQHAGVKNGSTFSHGFSSLLANFGLMMGIAYGDNSTDPYSGPGLYYAYYPILGINQINLVDNDFKWTPGINQTTLDIKDTSAAHAFHYSITFLGTTATTPGDETTLYIKNFDDYTITTNYQMATITFDTANAGPKTAYQPATGGSQDANAAKMMSGATFNVACTHVSASNDNHLVQTNEMTYLTTSQVYFERNMFAFYNTTTNVTQNTTSYQLLGVDSSVLATGTTPTALNIAGLNYIPNYTGTPTSSGLSTGAIVGIVLGSLAGVALIGGLGYWLYQRNKHPHSKTPPTSPEKPTV